MRRQLPGWALAILFTASGIAFLVLFASILIGAVPLMSETGVVMLMTGGFACSGVGMLPAVRNSRSPEGQPRGLPMIFLLAGLLLWCAIPFVSLAGGGGWNGGFWGEKVGVKNPPIWFFAALIWGLTAVVLWVFIRHRITRRKQRKR